MDILILAIITRGLLIFILGAMAVMFWRRFRNEHNKFFFGYFVFFTFVTLIVMVVFSGDLLDYLYNNNAYSAFMSMDFPEFEENRDRLWIFYNLVRPPYLLALIVMYIALASQIQPLEIAIQQKSHWVSRGLFLAVILNIFIYIPAITYSIYTPIVIGYSLLLTIIGFFGNIGINLYLAIKTPGEIRRRSYLIMLGFVLFVLGLLWSLKLGWSEALNPAWSHSEDVIIGSGISTLSALCYYLGFKSSSA